MAKLARPIASLIMRAEGNLLQALIYNLDALYYYHYHAIGESWRAFELGGDPPSRRRV